MNKQLIYDTKFEEGTGFPGEKELIIVDEEDTRMFADNHSRPEDLLSLKEEYIEALNLIELNNHPMLIRKHIKKYDEIIKFLKEKRLIIFIGKNWMDDFQEDCYEISRRGCELIGASKDRYDKNWNKYNRGKSKK